MNLANRLCPIGCRQLSRLFCSSSTVTPATSQYSNPFTLEHLTGRAIIRLNGEMVKQFLQDLITNDMNHLGQRQCSIYSMFLNKNGRVLYDSIVYRTASENMVFVECDQEAASDLKKHLIMFRIRKKIDIDIVDDLKVWTAFNPSADTLKNVQDCNQIILPDTEQSTEERMNVIGCHDPRLKHLGMRIVAPSVDSVKNAYSDYRFVESDGNLYKTLRYRLGIAEGIDELPIGKCFPLESNCDYLHGVSFHKGCYLGQEFTARTHHTGVIRKRLMPLFLQGTLTNSCSKHIESTHGEALGKLRAFDENCGIGLLKVEQVLKEKSPFVLGGAEVQVFGTTEKPFWWSVEAPSLQSLKEKNA